MNPLREKNSEGDFVVLHQMVLMESRATLRKIALCEGLRDRFEHTSLSSKASNSK